MEIFFKKIFYHTKLTNLEAVASKIYDTQSGNKVRAQVKAPIECFATGSCLKVMLNKECFSALCRTSVTHGFCCVWSGWMLIG